MASPSRVGSKSGGGARRGLRVGLAAAGAGGGVAGRPFAVGPGPLRSDARWRRSEERPAGHPTGRSGRGGARSGLPGGRTLRRIESINKGGVNASTNHL